ncbi:MAG: sulfite exporter TauE/SafE family protein [Chloroflexi bacterium]|nr:sulfite exporter TauE/SafE family protein [Chloroflexota bacterium]MCH7953343.1 sulfite exporter TauE/SafE family protein [Chloroflexota bacterium]MCI0783589.1 sulfite exporter TauE/SafE family protein [Chloroflexota bacterium]MCI0813725.1 sulfite exporter TauE/SafE family protein [Chloroflexota bacterium]MCI0817596.1 sulfite exporter TauE/SafE family protein [Chloroflexota bacterium]
MSAELVVFAMVLAFTAATIQSVTGFGFSLTLVPLLAVAWEPKAAVPVSLLLALATNVALLAQVRGQVTMRRLPGLYLGLIIGIPLGVLFLERVDADTLQITVGVVVFAATILLYLQPSIDAGHDSFGLRLGAGAMGGALTSATSMGGPPVVLYLLGRETEIDRYRATLLAYFLPSGVLAVTAFVIVGRIDSDVLIITAAAVPAVVAGILTGGWLRTHLNAERFRRIVLGVLIATSISVTILAIVG